MKTVALSLFVLVLTTPLFAQSIQFDINDVTVSETTSGLIFQGLQSPEGVIPRLILEPTLPAIDQSTVMVIGGHIVDRPVTPPSVRSFVGYIEGDSKSNVAITYIGSNIFGLIQKGDGTTWVITRDMQEQTYTIASGTNAFTSPDCGFRDEGVMPDYKALPKASADGSLKELELAVETDSEFFMNTGGTEEKATEYLSALMSTVSSLYQREIGVVVKVVWARVWTNAPSDPYGAKGNPFALSDAVRANWAAYDDIDRDLFHAITASPGGGGGYAFPDAICRTESHAHGATSVQGWTDLSAPGFNYDTYIVSHEIGHNFNARHTHGCYYGAPLDTCEVQQGIDEGCLNPGQAKLPNPGSIMSYCGWTNLDAGNGYTVEMSFRDVVKTGMKEYAQTLECLSEVVLPVPVPETPIGDTLKDNRVTLRWVETWAGAYDVEVRGDSVMTENVLLEKVDLLLSNGHYEWRVRSSTVGATSAWSEWNAFIVRKPLPASVPLAPIGDTLSEGAVAFSWASSWTGMSEWELDGPVQKGETLNGRNHTMTLTEGSYQWRVRTWSDADQGEWSSWSNFLVVKEFFMPSASIVTPDGDTVGAGSIRLEWASQWAGEYELEMRGDRTMSQKVSGLSFMVDLSVGSYEWRVRAVDSENNGEWSPWASITVSDGITGVEEILSVPMKLGLW